jgi:hypothetical protein
VNIKVPLYGYHNIVIKRKAFWGFFKIYHSTFVRTAGPLMLQIMKEIETDQQQLFNEKQKVLYKLLANIDNWQRKKYWRNAQRGWKNKSTSLNIIREW